MKEYRDALYTIVIAEIRIFLASQGVVEDEWQKSIAIERPPKVALGDAAVPLFALARILKTNPSAIAEQVKVHFETAIRQKRTESPTKGPADSPAKSPAVPEPLSSPYDFIDRIEVKGPYLNFFFVRGMLSSAIMQKIESYPDTSDSISAEGVADFYGNNASLSGQRVVIEFSSPNTNKPLHLGHLRNNVMGESLRRLLMACGAEVISINLINDRGIHTCKAMLSYQNDPDAQTPQEAGMKPDHFVGDYYVRFEKQAKADPALLEEAQAMLRRWEAGDENTRELWHMMRSWALDGIQETYKRTMIHFDSYDFESETYLEGKEQVYEGVKQGVFYSKDDGAIAVDLQEQGLDEKVLLRADGTTLYVTQDIGTAIQRFRRYNFDRHIYVVANEQIYHFQVLFHILAHLKCSWAERLYHRSYGMVNLPEGKMKSREGKVVDADNLLDELSEMALVQVKEKQASASPEDMQSLADSIALAALHYYLLSPNPTSDISFDPQKSLSFTGSTGPYLQYTLTRILSIKRKAILAGIEAEVRGELITSDAEWELVCLLAEYPAVLAEAAERYDPSILAAHLFAIAQSFSAYYHECPIVMENQRVLSSARLALALSIGQVLRSGLGLLVIPVVDRM